MSDIELQIQNWLWSVDPQLEIKSGECHFEDNQSETLVSLYIKGSMLSLYSPVIRVNKANPLAVMQAALELNAKGGVMEGCWTAMIDNELVLCLTRNPDSLEQSAFINLLTHFIDKSHTLTQTLTEISQNAGAPVSVPTQGIMV